MPDLPPVPDRVRHLLMRDDEPEGLVVLHSVWKAICGEEPFPELAALTASREFKASNIVKIKDEDGRCQVYLYHYDDLFGLVISSEGNDNRATEIISSENYFGDALFTVSYNESLPSLVTENLWEHLMEANPPKLASSARMFSLEIPRDNEQDITRLLVRQGVVPPPFLEAHLRAAKIAHNYQQFEDFVPLATKARRRLDTALDNLQDSGALRTSGDITIPSSALVGVQGAEAVLARAEAKLRAAALGSQLATKALRALIPVSDKPTVFSHDLASGALLVRQADVEARYNAAARYAADGIKPLAQTAQALSVERQQAKQNQIAEQRNQLSEQRNNLTMVSAVITSFVLTLLAGIQTFANDKPGDPTHWPRIITASTVVAALPIIAGRWPEKKFRCPAVRSALLACVTALLWWAFSDPNTFLWIVCSLFGLLCCVYLYYAMGFHRFHHSAQPTTNPIKVQAPPIHTVDTTALLTEIPAPAPATHVYQEDASPEKIQRVGPLR